MATPRIPRSNGRYTATVKKSSVNGYQEYMIFDPAGKEHCAGRHLGSRDKALQHVGKILDRFNDELAGWAQIKLPGTRGRAEK